MVGAFYCVSRYGSVAPGFVASSIDREAMSCVGDVAHRSFCLIVSGIARAFRRGLCDCDRGEIEGAPAANIVRERRMCFPGLPVLLLASADIISPRIDKADRKRPTLLDVRTASFNTTVLITSMTPCSESGSQFRVAGSASSEYRRALARSDVYCLKTILINAYMTYDTRRDTVIGYLSSH